mgnify:CR=1 FL=1|jgi:ABC-type arginine transport system permease subunit
MINGNGIPIWMKFVSVIGVPSAIAVYLVYFLSSSVLGAINTHSDEHQMEIRMMTAVMQQLCVNTAESEAARRGCFPDLRD